MNRRQLVGLLPAWLLATACRERSRPSTAAPTNSVDTLEVAGRPRGWLALPATLGSIKLAVIGDSGRGWAPQHEVAAQMAHYRTSFPFRLVLMLGDNIYEGPATRDDYRLKFEEPYRALLDADVRFQAVLGNHDDPLQRFYPAFRMGGQRYYTFEPPGNPLARALDAVRIFAIDSTSLDGDQLAWLDRELARSKARWKIVMLHHPLYTAGRYGASARLTRWRLESMFIEHGVDIVLSGHEHFYQRSELHDGVLHFTSGAAGSLREGDATAGEGIARSFDRDFSFMLMEIHGKALHFQSITRAGVTVDAGVVRQP